MRNLLLLAGVVAMVAAAPAGTADEQYAAVGITNDGTITVPGPVTEHNILNIPIPGMGPGPTASCSAAAPAGCSTGLHLSMYQMTIGFPTSQPGYTGTAEVKVTWLLPTVGQVAPVGAQVFRCNWNGGVFVGGCVISPGQLLPFQLNWPPPGTIFEHTCTSYALGTNTPGGSGAYSCFVTHL